MELDLLSLIGAGLVLIACASAPSEPAHSEPFAKSEPTPVLPPPVTATAPSAAPELDAGIPQEAGASAPDAAPPPAEPAPLPEGTVVLHIGDSMAGALGVALNDELKQHKVKGWLRFKKASYIPSWAWSKELPLYLAQFKPDLVLITLGTNEVKMPDPTERVPLIKKLVERLGGRPCVWIAPPVWTRDNGLYDVIRANIAPCRWMDTEQVYPNMPRIGDKIHPTVGARKEWARRVVRWLETERQPEPDRPWALRPEP
jgi:hypothetical protein